MGTIIGLLVSPLIIDVSGWPALFFILGTAGISWTVWFISLVREIEQTDPAGGTGGWSAGGTARMGTSASYSLYHQGTHCVLPRVCLCGKGSLV